MQTFSSLCTESLRPSAVASAPPQALSSPLISSLVLSMCLFWTFHINRIAQCLSLCDWLISLRLLPVVACVRVPLPSRPPGAPLYGRATSIEGPGVVSAFGYCENAAVNMGGQAPLSVPLYARSEGGPLAHGVAPCLAVGGTATLLFTVFGLFLHERFKDGFPHPCRHCFPFF